MPPALTAAAVRIRLLIGQGLARLGFRGDAFLLVMAVIVGIVTAAAAVAFHELVTGIGKFLYEGIGGGLYGRWVFLIALLPAAGGLAVGLIGRYILRAREGSGIIDVMESVVRASGKIKPGVAVEKIVTSAITIGTGGSAGAEGPIVQIGAGIASGVGQLFRIARQQMPVLIGCGSAAGISAIFNAPIGGVLFTLEVILQDFSIRIFTPVVLASVIANVTTRGIFHHLYPLEQHDAIFALPVWDIARHAELAWGYIGNFAVLGLLCGLVAVSFTRLMYFAEGRFGAMRIPRTLKPAVGGLAMGLTGVLYVVVFGWWMLHQPKPIAFEQYPMPAFFGDGYGVIRRLLESGYYASHAADLQLLLLLTFLCGAKIVGTCLTLASGGSGGIIAPSLFLGATAGAALGVALESTGVMSGVSPEIYALVGMGAALAAVVHAPLTAILILLELTHDYKMILPAMLASVIATGVARSIFRDSIYTLSLRKRGVRIGTAADLSVLRRITVEQTVLQPVCTIRDCDPFQRVLDLSAESGVSDFVVLDEDEMYVGMITDDDIHTALLEREAVPLLLVRDMMRTDVPTVPSSADLATVLDTFAQHEVDNLPISVPGHSDKVIGLIGRSELLRRYQLSLAESA